jgi:hypothetical protein
VSALCPQRDLLNGPDLTDADLAILAEPLRSLGGLTQQAGVLLTSKS